MYRIRQTISTVLMIALVSLGMTATSQAQRRPYRLSDRQVGELIRRLETDANTFRRSLDTALDRSRIDGTGTEDNINSYVRDFQNATDQLRSSFDARRSVAADVENVLQQAANINGFILNTRLNTRVQNDWSLVRTDLNALANAYGVAWNWNRNTGYPANTNTYPSNTGDASSQPYRLNYREVDAIIRRVETNAGRFRTSLDMALDRTRSNSSRNGDINQYTRDFENSVVQLRQRFNNRQSVAADVENVLSRASYIDAYMRNNNLIRRAENDWLVVRANLDSLATVYNVAWNWNNPPTYPTTGGGYDNYGTSGSLTGTYRLDPSRSDNARDVADRATRNLPTSERQRIYDRVLARLEAPEQLAIERRGSTVQIASTRAQAATFEADGRERVETLPNGRSSSVRATLNGDQLIVSSTGYRENDYSVTFEPIEQGRRLRVTRKIYNERLGQNPIIVQNTYDRISDTARFDIYNGAQSYPTTGSTTGGGDSIVNNGETLIAVLDNDLSTKQTRDGDRFTMTVREPARFEGATIEGTVSNVNRSGRISGRSELSLNFDTIRLRNGQTYQFAGFVDSVRTQSGESVKVDNEGTVKDDNQTEKTVQRAAIGTAVGAIIGAIAGGGKGAAIGAILGGGAGAGSVYVQGQDDLQLLRGTEVTIRASAPNR